MAEAFSLSYTTSNPQRAKNAMRHVMKQTTRLLKANYVVDLIRNLTKRGLPLREVCSITNKLCRGIDGSKPNVLSGIIMRWKFNDAMKAAKRSKCESTKVWRETEPMLREYGVSHRFNKIWSDEKWRIKKELDSKKMKKIAHLTELERRRTNAKRTSDNIRGIKISDQQVAEMFESRPRVYANTEISGSERQVLELPPKFAVYDEVDVKKCEVEIEKAFVKLRWSKIRQSDNMCTLEELDSEGEEETAGNHVSTVSNNNVSNVTNLTRPNSEYDISVNNNNNDLSVCTDDSEGRIWPYEHSNRTLDLRHLRSTDLPFNRYVHLPSPLKNEEEVKVQNLKNNLIGVTRSYVNERKRVPTTEGRGTGLDRLVTPTLI